MEVPRNLTQDLLSRVWQEYADACVCHDKSEPCVEHARDLARSEELVGSGTAKTGPL